MQLIINFIRVLFIGCSIVELCQLNIVNVVLMLGSCALTFIPELYTKLTKTHIPIEARLFYNCFLLCSQFFGSYLGAYTFFHWWDIMLHLVSGVMIGYVALILLVSVVHEPKIFQKKYALFIALFIFTVGGTGAVIWEIIEFTGDTFLGTNAQLGSLQDTMEDLICGTSVGGVFALYMWWVIHNEKNVIIDKLIKCNFSNEGEQKEKFVSA